MSLDDTEVEFTTDNARNVQRRQRQRSRSGNPRPLIRMRGFNEVNNLIQEAMLGERRVAPQLRSIFANIRNRYGNGYIEPSLQRISRQFPTVGVMMEHNYLRGFANEIVITPPSDYSIIDIVYFMIDFQPVVESIINMYMIGNFAMRVMLVLDVKIEIKPDVVDRGGDIENRWISSKAARLNDPYNHRFMLEDLWNQLIDAVNEKLRGGSAERIVSFDNLMIKFGYYTTSSQAAGSWIAVSKQLNSSGSVWNPKNIDNKCFLWCLLMHYHHEILKLPKFKDPGDIEQYRKYLVVPDLPFNIASELVKPLTATSDFKFNIGTDIDHFQALNPNYAINVFSYDLKQSNHHKAKGRLRVYPGIDRPYVVNLCLVSDEKQQHLLYIHNFNRFMTTGKHHTDHWCLPCMRAFTSTTKLEEHRKYCNIKESEPTLVTFPKKSKSKVKFKHYAHLTETPYYITADIESINKRVRYNPETCKDEIVPDDDTDLQTDNTALPGEKTVFQYQQRAYSIGFYLINTKDYTKNRPIEIIYAKTEEELNTIGTQFFNALINIYKTLDLPQFHKYKKNKDEDIGCHPELENCCAECDEEQSDFIHSGWKLPIFVHNLSGYDGHFFVQWLTNEQTISPLYNISTNKGKKGAKYDDIYIIPNNQENYKTIVVGNFRFVDSLAFFKDSLDGLVNVLMGRSKEDAKKLKELLKIAQVHQSTELQKQIDELQNKINQQEMNGKEKFKFMKQEFERTIGQTVYPSSHYYYKRKAFDYCLQKGEFPYEYLKRVEQFKETQLPPASAYANKLRRSEGLTEDEYNKEKDKWDLFNMRTFQDMHDLYLSLDVVLLADVLENYRINMRDMFKNDYTWYISLPSYGMDALLNYGFINRKGERERIVLDVFYDNADQTNMFNIVHESIRGGISVISHRYSKAINKYIEHNVLVEEQNETKAYNMYYDCNQLYGTAMKNLLPYNDFKLIDLNVNLEYSTPDFIQTLDDEGEHGYFYLVDLDYPAELHDLHSDYPLCPVRKTVKKTEFSPTTVKVMNEYQLNYTATPKLCGTLEPKRNYLIHYRNLKFALQKGLKLIKVHAVIKFRQERWMADFIERCVQLRNASQSQFAKDLAKLVANSVYGKMLEDQLGRVVVRLIKDEENNVPFQNCLASPYFSKFFTVANNPDLVGVCMKTKECEVNKPISVGFAILEISKLIMQKFWYDCIKPRYGDKVKLLMTDTDSFEMRIETNDFYRDLLEPDNPIATVMDYSNYGGIPYGYTLIRSKHLDHFYPFYGILAISGLIKTWDYDADYKIVLFDKIHKKDIDEFIQQCRLKEEFLRMIPPHILLHGMYPQNNKKEGCFKDESAGQIIKEFIGLKPKMYSNMFQYDYNKKTAKGLPRRNLELDVSHNDYFEAFKNNKLKFIDYTKLGSQNHAIFVQAIVSRLGLSGFDTKRWITEDGMHTLPFGHKDIPLNI
jgi:hypothetical protein